MAKYVHRSGEHSQSFSSGCQTLERYLFADLVAPKTYCVRAIIAMVILSTAPINIYNFGRATFYHNLIGGWIHCKVGIASRIIKTYWKSNLTYCWMVQQNFIDACDDENTGYKKKSIETPCTQKFSYCTPVLVVQKLSSVEKFWTLIDYFVAIFAI